MTENPPPKENPDAPYEINCMALTDFPSQPWLANLGTLATNDVISGIGLGLGSAALTVVAATGNHLSLKLHKL
jgi:hypothetical protein